MISSEPRRISGHFLNPYYCYHGSYFQLASRAQSRVHPTRIFTMIAYDSLLRQRVIAKNGGTHAVVQRDVTEASEFLTVMNLSLLKWREVEG